MRTGEGSGSGAAAPRLHRPQAEPGAGRPPQRSSPDLPRLLGTESRLAETRFIQLKVTKQGKLSSPFPLFFFFFSLGAGFIHPSSPHGLRCTHPCRAAPCSGSLPRAAGQWAALGARRVTAWLGQQRWSGGADALRDKR